MAQKKKETTDTSLEVLKGLPDFDDEVVVEEGDKPKNPAKPKTENKQAASGKVDTDLDTTGIDDIVNDFYKQQTEKELQGEIKGNYTFVVRHDLMERLNFLDEHYERGFKSDLVNQALEAFVSLYEKKPLPPKKKKKGRK
ncbi:hypothetical protein Q9R38_26230 [Priestia aryabhattai]|uniref:hypothetical protein n=1 Tax=Priestia aryabhattai TaxID=412384 RepID=UPI002882CFFB|nr:hypothetical protein [Priestia aryabhattai]MDT0150043.1 hypothetical protein [Priestia aryabhattai]MDT0155613.1 hypothetical protein [Priestia aryabhattai]